MFANKISKEYFASFHPETILSEEQQLANAIALASAVHVTQTDKSGKPYILHPLWIMNNLLYDFQLATIGVLHDVLEDSDVTIEDLVNQGYSRRVLAALELLTHNEEDSYEKYISRICINIDAIRVKRKDLEHNSVITRLKGVSKKDIERVEKYHKAFLKLGEAKKNFGFKPKD